MKYLTGEDRGQIPLFVGCLEEAIEADNEVRLIDAFVEALPLGDAGCKSQSSQPSSCAGYSTFCPKTCSKLN